LGGAGRIRREGKGVAFTSSFLDRGKKIGGGPDYEDRLRKHATKESSFGVQSFCWGGVLRGGSALVVLTKLLKEKIGERPPGGVKDLGIVCKKSARELLEGGLFLESTLCAIINGKNCTLGEKKRTAPVTDHSGRKKGSPKVKRRLEKKRSLHSCGSYQRVAIKKGTQIRVVDHLVLNSLFASNKPQRRSEEQKRKVKGNGGGGTEGTKSF